MTWHGSALAVRTCLQQGEEKSSCLLAIIAIERNSSCLLGSIATAKASGQKEHGKTDLAIDDLAPGVENGGIVHNLDIPRLQLLGQVKLWALSQGRHSPIPNCDSISKHA